MSARAEPHGARLLANQTRRVGLCGFCSARAAAHQIDAVTKASRFLEIQCVRRSVHPAVKIPDGIGHYRLTPGGAFGPHSAFIQPRLRQLRF